MSLGPRADRVQVRLVGSIAVTVAEHTIAISAPMQCSVFAALAVDAGQSVSIDRIADRVWGDGELPDDPARAIRHHVWRLRTLLEPDRTDRSNGSLLIGGGSAYTLAVDPSQVDLLRAEQLLTSTAQEADTDALNQRVDSLERLLATWHGEPLAGCRRSPWVDDTERDALNLNTALQVEHLDISIRLGGGRELVRPAQVLLAVDQYNEHVSVQLATALFRSGRQGDALKVLQHTRTALREDLGLDPGSELEETERRLLAQDESLLGGAAVPPRPANVADAVGISAAQPIPIPPTSVLVGRDDAISGTVELLENQRVVTLIGTGGIGKTSTARAVVEAWHEQHGGDSRFVSFEEISAQGIAAAVGQVVGTSTSAETDALGEVVDRICEAVDLLVLDNCEHIAEEVGDLIDQVAKKSSTVRILATSRRPLETMYEVLLPLRPLDAEASRTLLQNQLQRASIELEELDEGAVAELLDALDGLPLAIELAGANLRSVGVRELLSRWRNNEQAPRLRRGRQERHRSIANAIRSTLDELDPTQREVLRFCAFFPTDFDLPAIDAVAGTTVSNVLADLVDHSLLELHRSDRGLRYRMLVPIRAEVRAGSDQLPDRHREAFCSHFERISATALERMKRTQSSAGVADLQTELTNIAHAFDLADESADVAVLSSIVQSVGLANGISPSVGARVHLQDWVDRLRTHMVTDLEPALFAKAQTAAAWGLYGSNDGAWYRKWEAEDGTEDIETKAMAAIARFSRGQSSAAWELLSDLDLESIADPYMRAMFCGVGAVIAFEVGSEHGHRLTDLTVAAAEARASHGASFFAGLARSNQAFVNGDPASCAGILEATADAIDGHDLVTLENMSQAGVAMTVGFLLRERDPAQLLVALLDRYLEQHSLDPASVAMALDVAALHLDHVGLTNDAATLLGLLDRLGLSMAILRGGRVKLEDKVSDNPEWTRARAAGSVKTTFDVLRSTRTALAAVAV